MDTLVAIDVLSCYPIGSDIKKPLPPRMAWLTVDAAASFNAMKAELAGLGVTLRVSDMYRSYEDQARARAAYDAELAKWQSKGSIGAKPKFRSKPGYSFHMAGRAIDVDLASLKPLASLDTKGNYLAAFWVIAKKHGWLPIIKEPRAGVSESWHFDYPGRFKEARAKDYAKAANEAVRDTRLPG
jgi:LAS superfamily LD-carboxypeptidase LdcB